LLSPENLRDVAFLPPANAGIKIRIDQHALDPCGLDKTGKRDGRKSDPRLVFAKLGSKPAGAAERDSDHVARRQAPKLQRISVSPDGRMRGYAQYVRVTGQDRRIY
jgi:hypothetical protein